MMATGLILFTLSCIPTYLGSLHYYRHKHGASHIHIKTSKRYDDELLYHTTTAMYDTVAARECSMERKAFFIQLKKLRQSVETRCNYYEIMINKAGCNRELSEYYSKRIDEFRNILLQMPDC